MIDPKFIKEIGYVALVLITGTCIGLGVVLALTFLVTSFEQNSNNSEEKIGHQHVQRINPKHLGHSHVKSRANINGKSTLHIDEGLEDLEETILPEDIKTYVGATVVECDVLDSVYMTGYIQFDDDSVTYIFSGNIKCTTDDGAMLIPASVSVTLDSDEEVADLQWLLTSPIVFNNKEK